MLNGRKSNVLWPLISQHVLSQGAIRVRRKNMLEDGRGLSNRSPGRHHYLPWRGYSNRKLGQLRKMPKRVCDCRNVTKLSNGSQMILAFYVKTTRKHIVVAMVGIQRTMNFLRWRKIQWRHNRFWYRDLHQCVLRSKTVPLTRILGAPCFSHYRYGVA